VCRVPFAAGGLMASWRVPFAAVRPRALQLLIVQFLQLCYAAVAIGPGQRLHVGQNA